MTITTATEALRQEAGEGAYIHRPKINGVFYFQAYDDLGHFLAGDRDLETMLAEALVAAAEINAVHNDRIMVGA